jgi:hypothetical protein
MMLTELAAWMSIGLMVSRWVSVLFEDWKEKNFQNLERHFDSPE